MSNLVKLDQVSFSRKNQEVLQDISFTINKGDYIGLIGPNGAGKTTLLKIILGSLNPSSGKVNVKTKSSIGYVPQKNAHNLHSPVSVEEIILTGLKRSLLFRKKPDLTDVMKRVQLDPNILKKNFQELSGGQQQRVLIARSLINKPEILLFDEPFNGVDLPTQNKIYDLLKELNRDGVTILFISHDINTITKNSNRVLCLDKTLHEGCHPIYPEYTTKCAHDFDQNQLPIHHHNHT